MALLVYQNQLSYDLIIPGWSSTFHLYPGEYVGGEYYTQFSPAMLTDVTDQNIPTIDIKYIYPGSTDAPSGGGGIDVISGEDPIQVSTLNGYSTISMRPLTAADIDLGEMPTSVNGLTDNILVTGQAGISVDVNVGNNSIDITNTQLGLTDVYATPPLYLTLGEGNVSLEGSIAITPTDSGGAVALQTGTPEYQIGFAGLNSLYLKSADDTEPFLSILDSEDVFLTGIDTGGNIFAPSVSSNNSVSEQIELFDSVNYDGNNWTFGTQLINLKAPDVDDPSFVDIPFALKDTLSLEESEVTPDNFGNIIGTQGATYTNPFITLTTIPDQTTPLIKLIGGHTSGTANNNVYLEIVDDQDASLISLDGDGVITAKTVNADTVNVTTLNAENIYVTSYAAVGPTTINVTTVGPQTIIGNCFLGPIVVQLPDLNGFGKSLSLTIIKTDNTNHAISIVNGDGSTINGSPLAVDIVDQYESLTIVSNDINWFKIGAM